MNKPILIPIIPQVSVSFQNERNGLRVEKNNANSILSIIVKSLFITYHAVDYKT
jgi:hypothetical protein